MQILISIKFIIWFVYSTYCVAFCVFFIITDTGWQINLAQYLSFYFESSLSPDILCYIQNFTAIFCRCCRTSLWVCIIKLQIVSQYSGLLNSVSCWFCQYISTFLTVYLSFSYQRNLDTLFMSVILCYVESNFVINLTNQPLCSLVQDIFHSQISLKTIILSYWTNNWQVSFPNKPTLNELPMLVKLVNQIPIVNRILWLWTVMPLPQSRKPIFHSERENVQGLNGKTPYSYMGPSQIVSNLVVSMKVLSLQG